jgi:nicotinate-nucleotide pyrophosphorylase (carboxylating)
MNLKELVHAALREDVGAGDWTTRLTIKPKVYGTARVVAKADGILSGMAAFTEVFRQLDESISVRPVFFDGQAVTSGDFVIDLEGPLAPILTGERVALNFLQRLSGIATLTRAYVDAVQSTNAVILDTRKTTPLMRFWEKAAVLHGGGKNHRQGLDDMILIKDNHVFSCGGIAAAMKHVVAESKNLGLKLPIEIEVKDLNELDETLRFAGDLERIMLDNFNLEMIQEAVLRTAGRTPLEVSGGVTLNNVREIALAGVEYISVGALTHSVPALDLSLLITE